jgi:predicted  nucleic acid-binding Zn-ribbon protein
MPVTNEALLRSLQLLHRKVDILMSQSDEISAEVTDLEATATAISNGVTAALAHITDLEAQVAAGQPVDPAVLASLKQAVTDIGTAAQGVGGLATA